MVKTAALACLLLSLISLTAQTPEELAELDAPAQAESAWNHLFQELREQPLALETRVLLAPDNLQLQATTHCQLPQAELLALYHHRFSISSGAASFRLKTSSPRWESVLGSYRFRFGRGLVSGSASRASPDSLYSLLDPLSPQNYSPQGAALSFRHGALRAAIIGSTQAREARVNSANQLLSLAKTRSTSLSTSQESVCGVAAGLELKKFRAGALLYWRHYDLAFADAGIGSSIWAGSVFGAIEYKNMTLDAEAALAGGEPNALVTWRYKVKNFDQSLSYGRNGIKSLLPYALSPGVLSSASGRDELNYNLNLSLPFKTNLRLRYTLNSGSGFSGGALSRLMGSLGYINQGRSLKLVFHSYDREIITLVDSTYVATDPRNHRFQLEAKFQILPRLWQQLELGYTMKDQADYTQNTYRIRFDLACKLESWDLGLGYLAWQSPHEFWQAEELDPWSYDLYGASDRLLTLDLSWRSGAWGVSLEGRKSLGGRGSDRVWLRLFWGWREGSADSA